MTTIRRLVWSSLLLLPASAALAGEVRGRVLLDNKGVAGATVTAVPFEPALEEARRLARKGEAPKALASTTTKADGTYVLALPAPAAAAAPVLVRLQVSGKGLAPTLFDAVYDAAESAEAGEVAVGKASTLAGKVVDRNGGPAVGATVTLASSPPSVFAIASTATLVPATTTTGADGTFRFSEAARGGNRVRVEAPGFAFAEANDLVAGAVRQPLTLALGRTLSGTVVAEGKKSPVAGVLVRLETARGASRWAETRADGAFLLDGLPPDGGNLVADAGDRGRGTLAVEAGVAKAVVALAPTAAIQGRVVDAATGAPIPRVRVLAAGEGALSLARSGPDGRYEIRGLPARTYKLSADDPSHVPWSREGILVAPAARESQDVILTRAAGMVGRVVDENGAPVDGAMGTLTTSGDSRPNAFFRRMGMMGGGPLFRTGPDGSFKVTRTAPGRNQTLTVRHSDFESRTIGGVALSPGAPLRMNVVLRRGNTVRGFVKDERGQPIADADVNLLREFRMQSRRGAMQMAFTGGDFGRPGLKTGADGRFEAKGIAAGDYTLNVSKRGYGRERVDPVKVADDRVLDPFEVVLKAGSTITGFVRDKSGNGLAGQRVSARPAGASGRGQQGPFAGPTAEEPTGPDGSFVVEGVMPGESYDLQVFGETGMGPRKANVTAPAEGVELTGSGRGGIRGVVHDADSGRPLRDFEVTYRASRQGGGMQMRFSFGGRSGRGPDQPVTFHAEDGAFLLEEVLPGKWDVEVKAEGYQPGTAGGIQVDEASVAESVEVRLSKGGVITGRVLESRSGSPVRDAALRARLSGSGPVMMRFDAGEERRQASSDADGKFELTGLAPGTYTVTATHSDWTETSESVELKAAAATVEIKMGTGASVVGAVMGASQKPVGGASVSLAAVGAGPGPFGSDEQSTLADPGGRFRFERLTPGRYTLTASLRTESSPSVEVVIPEGDGSERSVNLSLRAGATVRGTVSGLPEAQRGGVNISASGPEEFFANTRTEANGAFEFTGVPVGAINLHAQAGDFMTSTRSAASQLMVSEGQLEVAAEIVFEEGFRLDGHVTRGGKPVTDATVSAFPEGGGRPGGVRGSSGRTDESGAFVLEGLAAGSYSVNAFPQSGGGSIRKSVNLTGDMSVELEAPPARLSGLVVELGSGRPLGDAEIRIEDPQPAPGRGGMMMAQNSDSGGRFAFEGLEPKAYRLNVQKAAYQTESRQVTAGEDSETTIELRRGEGIEVVAKDATYQTPLRSLWVRVADGQGATAYTGGVTLDSDGRGEIPSLRPGSYKLTASSQGYSPVGPVPITVPSSTVSLSLYIGGTLELQVGPETMGLPTPTGRILLSSGAPYQAGIFGPGDGAIRLSAGVRRMENIAAGSYIFAVEGGARKPFEIRENGTASVVLP